MTMSSEPSLLPSEAFMRRTRIETSRGVFSALTASTREVGPLVIWSHATGFHAAAYEPLLKGIAKEAQFIAPDARGHGNSAASDNPAQLRSWHVYYDDLISVLDALPARTSLILAGHSAGATASVFAAAARPQRVSGLVLAEPVLYPPTTGNRSKRQLIEGARRRRVSFSSSTEAFDTYRGRGVFRTFPDEWLSAYVNGAFRSTDTGEVILRCSPEWERRTFETNEPWPWRAVLRARCPATILLAENRSSCPTLGRFIIRRLQPKWRLNEIKGTSHMLPMERPDIVLDAIRTALHISRNQ